MKLLTLPLLILSCLAPALHAQTPGNVAPRTFRVITNVGSINELKFDVGPSKTVTLNIQSQLSAPMFIPDSPSLVLYREVPPPPDSPPNTPPTKQTMATVSIPKAMTKAIVVIAATSPSDYSAVVFDDGLESHPANTLKVFNLSGMTAALKIRKDTLSVTPGKTTLCPYPPGPTSIQVAVQRGSDWAMAMDLGRISRPNLRAHVFVFNYQFDAAIHDKGAPPPALVRFYTEGTPVAPVSGISVTSR